MLGLVDEFQDAALLTRGQFVARRGFGTCASVVANALLLPTLHRPRIDLENLTCLVLASSGSDSLIDEAQGYIPLFVRVSLPSSPQSSRAFFDKVSSAVTSARALSLR